MRRIIVIGGGISGLSALHRLLEIRSERELPIEVSLLEAGDRVGGVISTVYKDGFVIERGPDSFLTSKPELIGLCKRIGLGDDIIPTNAAHRRTFVVRDGSLLPVPEGFMLLAPTEFLPFLTSSVFSWPGKLRILMDLLLPRKRGSGDESLASFVRRRFGSEALDRVAQPMISGIYAADPERLSVSLTMPRFIQMEERFGSVIRGMLAEKRLSKKGKREGESGARYGLIVSLRRGMQSLVDALLLRIPEGTISLNRRVESVTQAGGGWAVSTVDGVSYKADAVIIAAPSYAASKLAGGIDPSLSKDLGEIEYASTAVVNLAFDREDIRHRLDGFGFVVPAAEGRAIIACSFTSVKFSERAPEGKALFRCFIGGALNPGAYSMDDDSMLSTVLAELDSLLGVRSEPLFSLICRHPASMPQYAVGHLDHFAQIRNTLSNYPTLRLAGNAYSGIGTPDCVRSGEGAAEEVVKSLFS